MGDPLRRAQATEKGCEIQKERKDGKYLAPGIVEVQWRCYYVLERRRAGTKGLT